MLEQRPQFRGRPIDAGLIATLITDLGGSIPLAFLAADPRIENANAWDFVVSFLLFLCVVGQIIWFVKRLWRPYVEWTLRVAGGVWTAYAMGIILAGHLVWYVRVGFGLIFLGVGLMHLVFASRIERGVA